MKKQNSNKKYDGWKDGGTFQNFRPLPSQVSTFELSCKIVKEFETEI